MTRFIFVISLLLISLAPTLAADTIPRNQVQTYEVQIAQRNRHSTPWTGVLTITVNDQGIVSGRYRSNSIRPDPFRNQIVNVSGGLTGDNINLSFGTGGRLRASGTISEDQITASFWAGTTLYNFNAVRVTGS